MFENEDRLVKEEPYRKEDRFNLWIDDLNVAVDERDLMDDGKEFQQSHDLKLKDEKKAFEPLIGF
jgi:hypothetical protein